MYQPFKVLVCGGRNYGHIDKECNPENYEKACEERNNIYRVLNGLGGTCLGDKPNVSWFPRPDLEIISGMAPGVDTCAAGWAISNGVKLHEFPADWKKYGRSAGYRRNAQMLEEGQPDLVIAFPGGKGTAMMVDLARKAGVAIEIVKE